MSGQNSDSVTVDLGTDRQGLPEARKKVYVQDQKVPTPEEEQTSFYCKTFWFSLLVVTIVTLVVLSTGDRPLASSVRAAMDKSSDWITGLFVTVPDPETDALGGDITEEPPPTTTRPPWTTPRPPPPRTRKPLPSAAVPADTLILGSFKFELFSQFWTYENATSICARRNGHLVYFENFNEVNATRHWLVQLEKTRYAQNFSVAGQFYTSGVRNWNVYPAMRDPTDMSDSPDPPDRWEWTAPGAMKPPVFQFFCRERNRDIGDQNAWDGRETRVSQADLNVLRVVMNFKNMRENHPELGCWTLQYPLVEEEINDFSGQPFICKVRNNS